MSGPCLVTLNNGKSLSGSFQEQLLKHVRAGYFCHENETDSEQVMMRDPGCRV